MAKEYQAVEKARPARIHNEKLSRKEQAAVPKSVNDDSPDEYSEPKYLFRPGSRVWLYMERVKPGLVKKLAHRWHDEVAREFEVEAILNDRTPMSTSADRPARELEVKWVGYESTTWEPASNLSCGGLLYDYLRNKKSEQRLQMVQVADED
ncbi:hypothetical protein PHMEG_00037184 [Phytophthora megakarya]|uniref:Chromo domain-containing protein n=1 Tax=Phytophthora megakarya TaxID=4795 RepID=A0A225UMR2_9STRA|nr:hypothetical protein PHMEG_00037184 [Phytophthora megakarya]